MSNIAGKAYAMNVLTPMRPRWTWIQHLIFMVARAGPAQLSGLLGLKLIHFARWVIIRRDQWPDLGQGKQAIQNDYMLFLSNFNGTWDQYIDAFSDALPSGLDLLWYSSIKYPHSIPITASRTKWVDRLRANGLVRTGPAASLKLGSDARSSRSKWLGEVMLRSWRCTGSRLTG